MKIKKLEASKRQIIHAIEQYFAKGDPIVIHVLIGGAHQILCDIGRKKGIKSIKDQVASLFKNRNPKKIGKQLDQAKDFFKHAASDPNEEIDFCEDINELWLLDSCLLYEMISGEIEPRMRIFQMWMGSNDPKMLTSKKAIESAKKLAIHNKNPQEFFKAAKEVILDYPQRITH